MNEDHIKVLLKLKGFLEEQIETKREEIIKIVENIRSIDDIIHNTSFKSADLLLSTIDTENFMSKHTEISYDNVENTRKLHLDDGTQVCRLKFTEEMIYLYFLDPTLIGLTQERYIEDIVQSILVKIKKNEPEMDVEVRKIQDQGRDYIKGIILKNIHSYDSFEFIFDAIKTMIKQEQNTKK